MLPVLFRIGDFEITSFGVLVAIGALLLQTNDPLRFEPSSEHAGHAETSADLTRVGDSPPS